MITTNFTEFRQNAKSYMDAVEKGEKGRILRHGKAVADLVPAPEQKKSASSEDREPLWKKPGLRLKIKGVSLSDEVIKERRRSRW